MSLQELLERKKRTSTIDIEHEASLSCFLTKDE